MAIGATAHKMILDSTKFVEGATLGRKELSFLKQVLRETATDADKFGAGLDRLADLQKKGALTTEQYERAVEKLKAEFSTTAKHVDQQANSFAQMQTQLASQVPLIGQFSSVLAMAANPAVLAVTATVAAGAIAFKGFSSAAEYATEKIAEQLGELDKLTAASDKLGISAKAFQNIATAADFADISAQEVEKSVEKMLVAISKGASDKPGKFAAAFELLNVSAKELKRESPDVALEKILRGMEKIGNQADKGSVAKMIFGDLDILRLSADQIREVDKIIERLGGHISSLDAFRFAELDDTFKTLEVSVDAVWKRAAMDLEPALTQLVDSAMKIEETTGAFDKLAIGMHTFAVGTKAAAMGVSALIDDLNRLPKPPPWMLVAAGLVVPKELDEMMKNFSGRLDVFDKITTGMDRLRELRAPAENRPVSSEFEPDTSALMDPSRALGGMDIDAATKMGAMLDGANAKRLRGLDAIAVREEKQLRLLQEQLRAKQAINKLDTDVIRQGSREAFQIQGTAAAFGNRAQVEEVTLL